MRGRSEAIEDDREVHINIDIKHRIKRHLSPSIAVERDDLPACLTVRRRLSLPLFDDTVTSKRPLTVFFRELSC
jgi:hypothetical protein